MEKYGIELDLSNAFSKETIIWKYLSFTSFVSMILEKILVFRRVDLFADKLEGSLSELAQKDFYKQLLTKTDPKEAQNIVEREAKIVEDFKKFTYVNCWTINNNENYALWKIYLNPENKGLAIKTTIKKLKEAIHFSSSDLKVPQPLIIKDVSYKQFGFNESTQDKVFTSKNPEYQYESELRLLIKNQRDWNNKSELITSGFNDMPVIYVNIDLNILIDKLYISPFAESWFHNTLYKLLKLKDIDFDTNRICFSRIKELLGI